MDAQRKGRTTKATPALLVRTGDDNENMHDELSGAATLVAISPVDEEVSSPSAATTAPVADSVECRRSSRKKIPKFDVRDLLLKQHRKPHKIQIEARIDSNAPSTSRAANSSAGAAATTPRNLDKCFIEKTSIIQRTPTAAQIPIPVTTEIFKPSQTSSLIVAQMESSSPSQRQQKQPKSVSKTAKTPISTAIPQSSNQTVVGARVDSDGNAPKRRGRPPKNRSIADKMNEKPTVEAAVAEVAVIETTQSDLSTLEDVKKITSNEVESTTVEQINVATVAELTENNLIEEKIDCLNDNTTATEVLGKMCDIKTKEILIKNVTNSTVEVIKPTGEESSSDIISKKPDKSEESSTKHANFTIPKELEFESPEKTESRTMKNENSPQEQAASQVDCQEEITEEPMEYSSKTERTPEHELEKEQIPEIESPTFASKDLERKTTTPTPRRCERRSGRRLDDTSSNKTLEETFAEIAAKSSKAILELATQNLNKESRDTVSEHALQPTELTTDSLELQMPAEIQTTKSESQTEICDVAVSHIKKRAYKPKSKILGNEDSFCEETSLEQNESFVAEKTTGDESYDNQQEFERDILKTTPTVELTASDFLSSPMTPSTSTLKEVKDNTIDHNLSVTTTTPEEAREKICSKETEILADLSTSPVQSEATEHEQKHEDLAKESAENKIDVKDNLVDNLKVVLMVDELKSEKNKLTDSNERNQLSPSSKSEKLAENSKSIKREKRENSNKSSSDAISIDVKTQSKNLNEYSDKNQQTQKASTSQPRKEKSKDDPDSSTSSESADRVVKYDSKENLKLKSRDKHKQQQKGNDTNLDLDKGGAITNVMESKEKLSEIVTSNKETTEHELETVDEIFATTKETEDSNNKEYKVDSSRVTNALSDEIITEERFEDSKIVVDDKEALSINQQKHADENEASEDVNEQKSSKLKETGSQKVVESETFKKHEHKEFALEEQKANKSLKEKIKINDFVDDKDTFKKSKKKHTYKNDAEDKETFKKLQSSTSKMAADVKETSSSIMHTDANKYEQKAMSKKFKDKSMDKKYREDKDKEKYRKKLKEKSFEKYSSDKSESSKKLKKKSEKSYTESKEQSKKERTEKSAEKLEAKNKEKLKLEKSVESKDQNIAAMTSKSSSESKETATEKHGYKDCNIFDSFVAQEDKTDLSHQMKTPKVRKEKSTKDSSETKSELKKLKRKLKEQQTSITDLSMKEKKKAERQKSKHKHKSNESDTPTASSTPISTIREKQSLSPMETSKKSSSSSSSHRRQKKRKESVTPTGSSGHKESDDSKDTISKSDSDSKKRKSKEADKHTHKERQRKLQAALVAALETKVEPMPDNSELVVKPLQQKEQCTTFPDLELPPTPGSEKSSNLELSADLNEEKAKKSNTEPDPFYDIAKFIEDGVNLLKRDYKLDGEDEKNVQQSAEGQKELNENSIETKIQATEENETKLIDLYETPADTPATTPAQTTPSSSPIHTDNTDNSLDTYYYSDGKRRSHRLKKITSAPKVLEGRGLAKLHYSIEDHLTDLAEVEAKNAQFLKDMEERLSNFQVIKESEYHCERLISREARKMFCDCFLTPEEAERGELGCGEDCLNRLLMIECSANCKVGERCTNNRFQKILCAPCRVFRTEKKGFGIMADVEIHPGEFIMEYVGEVLDSNEFEKRRMAYSKDKNRHYYFMELRRDAIIDATTKGNISRFINHSCDPNAETQKWTVNGELRIGFFSRKFIMPGEEITFDYQYQRYGREAQRCYCESANCRGWIGEEPDSDEGEQLDDDDDDEEDEDEEEEDEDEEEVTSLVKGLLGDEDAAEMDGEKVVAAENDNAQGAALLKTENNLATSTLKPSQLDESRQKFLASLGKISAKLDLNKQRKLEEKKLRKKRKRKQVAEKRRSAVPAASRFLEDPDLEDEIDFLSRCGLKNQSDTLRFSRLMVRAKLIPTRLNLLSILREGELPCRRLFLDYHGLHLLHGWMNEDGRTDMTMRLALLQTLECLPIVNKTVLTESKVYQGILGWCSSEKQASTSVAGVSEASSSSSPSDESSKESNEQKGQKENSDTTITSTKSEEIEKSAAKLLSTWDKLPEIFRIPKRERIEQMKEHEREADRQYAATIEATESTQKTVTSTDRYQRDRFERRFGKQYGIRNIGVYSGPSSSTGNVGATGSSFKKSSSLLSSKDTKNLSKEQRRELFAARVAHEEAEKRLAERRREFETKCSFFGLDPRTTCPEDVPFCVSDSGQWYNERRLQISRPPAFAHVQVPSKPKSTNPADYDLPKAAKNLPPEWGFAVTDQGKIYYFHLKHRIPQWEPPTSEQISQTKWSDTESESDYDEEEVGAEEISEERIKEIEAIQSQEELSAFLKKIAQEQRQTRYKRLVEERPISPRREEDRIYNQIEMRKYKENKEKIKKRKEEIRRRRSEAAKSAVPYMCTLGSLLDAASKATSTVEAAKVTEPTELPADALPIQDYLLSSDDDAADEQDIDEMKAECNNSPLLEKIVQGDKIVDELDALTTKRQLKRPLPPHRDLSFDLNVSGSSGAATAAAGTSSTSGKDSSIDKIEYKKRRQEKKEKSKRSRDSNDTKYRKLKEKFRCEIAGIIVQHLKPYRKDSCTFGRIRSNEDFNHLAKKLTHFVMVKELKYCDAVGQMLVVTDSVKNKSREFIKKYMAKYEAGYVKPANDPEFKDIPFTL